MHDGAIKSVCVFGRLEISHLSYRAFNGAFIALGAEARVKVL
jgi:hypothetical protein